MFTTDELKKLQDADVMSKETNAEDLELEARIKELQKGSSLTLKLNREQLTRAQREAGTLGIDWKTYIKQKVSEWLAEEVGRSTITGPSFASGGKKVTGPSQARFQ